MEVKTFGSVWSNEVGQNKETNEEYHEDCVEEGFQLARVGFDSDGEGCRETRGIGNCSVNI